MDETKMNIPPMRITEDMVRNAKFLACDCGGTMFKEKMMFKRISKLLSPSGKDEVYPMTILVCDKCGKVPSDPMFNPNNLIPEEYIATKTEGANI